MTFRPLIFLWRQYLDYWSKWKGALLVEGWLLYPLLFSSLTLKLTGVKGALAPWKAGLYSLIIFRFSQSGLSKNRTTLAEPLLICDLPGQSISLGTQLRDNSDHVLDSLDGRVDGPDLSFDIETLQTMPGTEAGDSAGDTWVSKNLSEGNYEISSERVYWQPEEFVGPLSSNSARIRQSRT